MADDHRPTLQPGITLRSVAAAVCGLLVMGMHIQVAEVVLSAGSGSGAAVAGPAILVFLGLSLLGGLLWLVGRYRLLTRPELLCVLMSMILAAPMMTQGMWHRFVGLLSAPVRSGSFQFLDAYSDKLWPHGPNLVPQGLDHSRRAELQTRGNPPQWREVEYETGRTATLPVLVNEAKSDLSSITITIPLQRDGKPYLLPGEPYLISFLAKPENLAPDAFYFCRLHEDGADSFAEVINSKEKSKVTFLHQQGFLRVGIYGTVVGAQAQETVQMELGLSGRGSLALYDPKLFSVAATEGAYTGRRLIKRSEYDRLPPAERAGLVPQPDQMLSPAGLWFLLTGYIPLRPWLTPALAWSTLIFCLLLATLALNVLMRKQWAESERYPFPMFQIPYALIGTEEEDPRSIFAAVWRNPYLWVGFGLSLAWGLVKGWHFYDNNIPALNPVIDLKQYLSDPRWGLMWEVKFTVSAVALSLAVFMELNVLLSLVVGFFLYRALFWIGEFTNFKTYTGYPFRYEQAIGAYIAYAAVVVFFTRRYLGRVLRQALGRANVQSARTETFSYRAALLLLAFCFVGVAAWAVWLGVSPWVILLYFTFLVLIGFVAAKLRAEAGLLSGYFTPYNAMLLLALLGGMTVFGANGILVCLVASGFITVAEFFLIPGAQLELMEFGRRYRMVPRHVLYACVLGILGGLFLGGWSFLSNAYALGGDNLKYQWAFDQNWFYGSYRSQLSAASSNFLRASEGIEIPSALAPATWGYVLGAVPTLVVATLRQLWAGFWFHPIGVILASSHYLEGLWGSLLVAWVIRALVLRLGGAATVKRKLLPFFVGFFVAAVLCILLWNLYGFHLHQAGVDRIYTG